MVDLVKDRPGVKRIVPHRPKPMGHYRGVTSSDEEYTRSPSANWTWRKVMLPDRAHPEGTAQRDAGPLKPLRARDAHLPMQVTVQFRGGPEASWLITYRGRSHRFPGHLALHDVLMSLSQGSDRFRRDPDGSQSQGRPRKPS